MDTILSDSGAEINKLDLIPTAYIMESLKETLLMQVNIVKNYKIRRLKKY